jgi:uncharacterized protein (DUF427 family)
MANPAPGFEKNPDRDIRLEPSPRRVRVRFGDKWIADSTEMMLMYESGHLPVYYFPVKDVRLDLLHPTEHSSYCQYKGDASYWTIEAGGRKSENAIWAYQTPYDEMVAIGLEDYCAFYWDRVDHWYEEDEEIFVHARDPYKRIDAIPSSREVRVVIGGETVARTTQAHFLFETGLPTRYYIPRDDVKAEFLTPTDTTTGCPYKGIAAYWSADIDGKTYDDIVWSYPDPVPECPKIKDLMCFYNENVDAILVDGSAVEKSETKWSK